MADYEALKQRLIVMGERDLEPLSDCFSLCVETNDHGMNKQIRRLANQFIRSEGSAKALELYWKTHLFDA